MPVPFFGSPPPSIERVTTTQSEPCLHQPALCFAFVYANCCNCCYCCLCLSFIVVISKQNRINFTSCLLGLNFFVRSIQFTRQENTNEGKEREPGAIILSSRLITDHQPGASLFYSVFMLFFLLCPLPTCFPGYTLKNR